MLLGGLAVVLVAGSGGCQDAGGGRPDATVELQADPEVIAANLRPAVMDLGTAWGATRTGETTDESGDTSLTFTLPGRALDRALLDLRRLGEQDGVELGGTSVQVDPEQVDASPAPAGSDPSSDLVSLRVEMTGDAPSAGAGVMVRFVMALFGVVGMLATPYLIWLWWKGRDERARQADPDGAGPDGRGNGTGRGGDDGGNGSGGGGGSGPDPVPGGLPGGGLGADWVAAAPGPDGWEIGVDLRNRPRVAREPQRRIPGWSDDDPPTRETPVVPDPSRN